MKTFILNPTLKDQAQYIREGRCMQKASSWATAWPPIGLAVMASQAEKFGLAEVWDGNVEPLTLEQLLQRLKTYAPDLVVVNTGFPSIDSDMRVAQAIKAALPQTKVLAFGVYFTMLEKQGMENYPFLDFALIGEPDVTFEELLERVAHQRTDYEKVLGLGYHDAQGRLHQTGPRPFLEDLDQLPWPDRDLLKNDRYRLPHNNRVFTLVNTARGCPYHCTYCIVNSYYGRKVRKRSVPAILAEIQHCVQRYHIRDFLFWEEVFSLDKQYVLDLSRALIEAKLKIHWAATTRVGTITDEVVGAMKAAGCYLIGLGVESGVQSILDSAKKQQTLDDIRRAVAICKQHKLQTMGHFIFGLPGETPETAEATIRFMLELGLDYMQSYCAVPYPKTELGDLAKAKGWIKAKTWAEYDFGGSSIMQTETATCEQVDAFRAKAFRKFYFRPWFIFKKLFRDLSIFQLFHLANFSDWMNLLGFGRKQP